MHCTATTTRPARVILVAIPILLLAMSGCGGDDDADPARTRGDGTPAGATSPLPAPEGAVGSVTGMPAAPGPGVSPIGSIDPAGAGTGAADAARSAEWAGMEALDGDAAGTASLAIGSDGDMAPAPALPDSSLREPLSPDPALPVARDRDAAAAPVAIVTEARRDPPVATDATTGVATPPREPVGTEGATETTTIVVEPAPVDD